MKNNFNLSINQRPREGGGGDEAREDGREKERDRRMCHIDTNLIWISHVCFFRHPLDENYSSQKLFHQSDECNTIWIEAKVILQLKTFSNLISSIKSYSLIISPLKLAVFWCTVK